MKKNFEVDTRVVIARVGSCELEGAYGTILGKSFVDVANMTDDYIVLLDKPIARGKAITITESCLDQQ